MNMNGVGFIYLFNLFLGIDLVYGRKTGYGGYGPSYFQRGGRVIKLNEYYDENGELQFNYITYNLLMIF